MLTFIQPDKIRLLRQGRSAREFEKDLYREHLEEVSIMYEQRKDMMNDPGFIWPDLEGIENRIRSHMDALELGKDIAINAACLNMNGNPKPGFTYAAVRTFCRQNQQELVQEILTNLDPENEDMITAVTDALKSDLPEDWHPLIEEMAASTEPPNVRMALSVIGHRRIPLKEPLRRLLDKPCGEMTGLIVKTLGLVGDKTATNGLYHLREYGPKDHDLKREITMALIRRKEKGVVPVPDDNTPQEPWKYLAMGISGGISHALYLEAVSRSESVCNECLLALGFLGYASSMDILPAHLDREPYSEAASLALYVMTGADLYETIFIPDPIDEFTLLDDEREKLRQGIPLYPPGSEPGITIRRISQNKAAWESWVKLNKTRFEPGDSYRLGKSHSPLGILNIMESEYAPSFLRQLAHDEFVIRHGRDFGFDITLTVSEQRNIIHQYKEWTCAHGFKE